LIDHVGRIGVADGARIPELLAHMRAQRAYGLAGIASSFMLGGPERPCQLPLRPAARIPGAAHADSLAVASSLDHERTRSSQFPVAEKHARDPPREVSRCIAAAAHVARPVAEKESVPALDVSGLRPPADQPLGLERSWVHSIVLVRRSNAGAAQPAPTG